MAFPWATALGVVGTLLGGRSGRPRPTYVPQPSPVDEWLKQQAYEQGFAEALAKVLKKEGVGYSLPAARQSRTQQEVNQLGGVAPPQGLGPGVGALRLGLGLGPGGSTGYGAELNRLLYRTEGYGASNRQSLGRIPQMYRSWWKRYTSDKQKDTSGFSSLPSWEVPTWPEGEKAYRAYIMQSLQGYGGLPLDVYSAAVSRGLAGIGAQARNAREALTAALGRRGLLRSGIYGQSLAELEGQRMLATAGLLGGLEEQNLAAIRRAQEQAAGLYASAAEAARNRALQAALEGRRLKAAEPSWADYLGSALRAGAFYYGLRHAGYNPVAAAGPAPRG